MMLALVVVAQAVEDQIFYEHSRECSSSKTFDNYYRRSQNIIVEITRKLAMVTIDEVVGLNSTTKVDVIQKYLAHPLVKGMVSKYLFDLSNVQQKHEVLTIV
jgi:CRISPR/Cas system-associated exonuclease Cas4 (RecB family)